MGNCCGGHTLANGNFQIATYDLSFKDAQNIDVPLLNKKATKIQAIIRGYLSRKKLMKQHTKALAQTCDESFIYQYRSNSKDNNKNVIKFNIDGQLQHIPSNNVKEVTISAKFMEKVRSVNCFDKSRFWTNCHLLNLLTMQLIQTTLSLNPFSQEMLFMKVNGIIVKNMVEENNFGQMVLIMKDIGQIIVNMGKEECFYLQEIYMKENGRMIKFMVLAHMCIQMVPNTLGNGKMINNMEKAKKHGLMVQVLKETIKMDKRMAMEYSRKPTDQFMRESFKKIDLKEKAIIKQQEAKDMLDNIGIIKCMDKEYFIGVMGKDMKATMQMELNRDMEYFTILMEGYIKDIGKMASNMEQEYILVNLKQRKKESGVMEREQDGLKKEERLLQQNLDIQFYFLAFMNQRKMIQLPFNIYYIIITEQQFMGNCCGGQPNERETQINLGAGDKQDPDPKKDEELVNEKAKIIQAHIRGHKAREEVKQIKANQKSQDLNSDKCIKDSSQKSKKNDNQQNQDDKNQAPPKETGYQKATENPQTTAAASIHAPNDRVKLIERIPDYLTDRTRQVLDKLEPFVYDQDQDEFKDLPTLGPYEFENGSVYVGQWKSGQRHGKGKQIWQDGSIYEGYWYSNVACGKGRLIHSDGDIYEGDWRNDKAHGYGKYVHMDGAQYIGQWEDDRQNGEGKEIWPDGASYQGQYKNGKKDGKGTFKWADGSVYIGDFFQNNIQGQGEYSWEDGRKYVGEWKNNKMDGKGVFTWLDGRRYEGQYKDDKKHGYGEFKWPDGRIYKGEWFNGKQHGKGIYIGSSKVEKEGEWQDGKRIKWLKKGGQPVEDAN